MHPTPINTTVLLVDDQPSIRQSIRSVLENCEDVLIVGEAGDGAKAIQYARMVKPHVVLMDISMPEMNGLQAARVIKREDPETVIIGLSTAAVGTRALVRAGLTTYLNKESIVEDLYPTIARHRDHSVLPGHPSKRPWSL
jgi:DNA-binding NarL/FixJ family response regulator